MSDELTGGKAYVSSMTWAAAAEELRRFASQFSIERRQDLENKFMFRITAVQKKRSDKPIIPMHINFDMHTKTMQQQETQAILSAFDKLEALVEKCDRLEHERDLWREEAERWRKIARDPNTLSRKE